MIRLVLALLVALPAAASTAQTILTAPPVQMQDAPSANLRGLDTLNGVARDIVLHRGELTRFGHLELTLESCQTPSDDIADARAFLRIRDIREDAPRFSGWMFASSPALSALDHPRYDVWVLNCSNV